MRVLSCLWAERLFRGWSYGDAESPVFNRICGHPTEDISTWIEYIIGSQSTSGELLIRKVIIVPLELVLTAANNSSHVPMGETRIYSVPKALQT